MVYGHFKNLTRRTVFDEILHDKAFNVAKYHGYQSGLASVVYKLFDKKTSGSGITNENILKQELAEELHIPIIRNLKKREVYSSFIDNIWGADLADMQLMRQFNEGF